MTESSLTGHEMLLADQRPTALLVELALADLKEEIERGDVDDSDFDDDPHEAWEPVWGRPLSVLHARGTRDVLEAALRLCDSADPVEMRLGIEILRELGTPRTFPEECCKRLLQFLDRQADVDILTHVLFALGHLGCRDADGKILHLANHPDDEVRRGVAFALVGTQEPEAIATLLRLMRDPWEGARDWATTAIAHEIEIDGEHIRAALIERLRDEDATTRGEACQGLALRGDMRVILPLLREFKTRQPLYNEDGLDGYFEDAAKMLLKLDIEQDYPISQLVAMLKAL